MLLALISSTFLFMVLYYVGEEWLDYYFNSSSYMVNMQKPYLESLQQYIKKNGITTKEYKKLNPWIQKNNIYYFLISKERKLIYGVLYNGTFQLDGNAQSNLHRTWQFMDKISFADTDADVFIYVKNVNVYYRYMCIIMVVIAIVTSLLIAFVGNQKIIIQLSRNMDEAEKEKKKEQEERRASWKEHTPEVFEKKREESYRVMEAAKYEAASRDRREFIQKPVWQENHAGVQTSIRKPELIENSTVGVAGTVTVKKTQAVLYGNTPEVSKAVSTTAVPQEDDFFVEAVPPEDRKNPVQEQMATTTASGQPTASSQDAAAAPEPEIKNTQQLNLFEEKLLSMQNRSRYRIIGQVFDTYWLIQFEDKLFIIDQHAAHEKVKYERLMKQFYEKSVVSQRLMPAIIVSLTGQEESILHTYEDAFAQLGFEIDAFGGNEYALRSVPVDLYGCSERELFLAVLDELSQETGNRGSFQVIEEKIASMSCKAAVKGNNRLSLQEADQLIDELLTLDNPYNCPHGRPTIIAMTETDLEKKFKRIV